MNAEDQGKCRQADFPLVADVTERIDADTSDHHAGNQVALSREAHGIPALAGVQAHPGSFGDGGDLPSVKVTRYLTANLA